MKKFEHQNTKCPNVGLGPINIFDETFGRHVDWRTDVDIFKF